MKNSDPKPEWTLARVLLADLKSATRRSLSAQVLLGKELKRLKNRLGSSRGANKGGPMAQFGPSAQTWANLCQEELDLPKTSADRYIQCFEAALTRAKARKAKEPEACLLLEVPAVAMTGDEVEKLANFIDQLVDHDTQAGLLEELGIGRKSDTSTKGGKNSTSKDQKEPVQLTMDAWAVTLFREIPKEIAALEKTIFSTKDHPDYKLLLQQLPVDRPENGNPCLMGIKECLERLLHGRLAIVLKDVEAAIGTKMGGPSIKRNSGKSHKTSNASR